MPKYRVIVGGQAYVVEILDLNERPVRAVVDGELFEVQVESELGYPEEAGASAFSPPASGNASLPAEPAGSSVAAALGEEQVVAPLPGTIVSISVDVGDHVVHGQELCVLEAMKMNNPIRSTRSGVVKEILVQVGEQVQHGAPLMVIAEA